ncbi:CADMIUM-INDUCED PROTEIN AS8 [Salix purpurea]|uniref:CADMIUM-INDUCED PROTEIN AS8 n=1 Tax=Salix purpurea TaxID=77065 RepID=A0A9Q0TIL2_SALPP|nr:CADMIUM-INDUCED PROTEIN AS8 [Salix purpurea]
MIIKGLCRRYERWNPVHPTSGAFWGMGIGIGCGIGWGPGFGPEAIGYVGAGCGVGFSVGITLVGFGIGLPANYLFQIPYNAIVATSSGALAIARSNGLLSARDVAGEGWNNVASRASLLQRETSGRLCGFNKKVFLDNGVDLIDMKSKLSVNAGSLSKVLETFSSRFFPPGKGLTSSGYVFRAEVDATSKCMSVYAAMGLALDI